MLFVIFALVIVIATGIPFVKKGIENRNNVGAQNQAEPE